MSNIDKQALTDEAISKAFAGTNFGRDDFKNILAETVIDAAAGWRCGYTATTICTQLGLLTPKGCASALGLRFISEHVQRETKRLKDELEAKDNQLSVQRDYYEGVIADGSKRISELEAREVKLPDIKNYLSDVTEPTLDRALRLTAKGVRSGDVAAIRAAGIRIKGED